MLHTTLIIISMIAMTLAAPMTPSNVTAMAATNGNAQGVVLCSGVGGQGECKFAPLEEGACIPLPCDAAECKRNMDGTWKTFFVNLGTVCVLHVSDNCKRTGLRADPILFPGAPDIEAWGRDPARGWHGSEVTYLRYMCYGTGV